MDNHFRRPTVGSTHGPMVTTPKAATMIQLLGAGASHDGILISRDECDALRRTYGFITEKPTPKPPRPEAPTREQFQDALDYARVVEDHKREVLAWEKWEDPSALAQAGADRNMMRFALADGLRLVAWLARYAHGEDPLKCVIQAAVDAGWDVDPSDIAWADAVEDEQDGDMFEATGAADGATEGT